MTDKLQVELSRQDIVLITAALSHSTNDAYNSDAYKFLRLSERLLSEWNNEMHRRKSLNEN